MCGNTCPRVGDNVLVTQFMVGHKTYIYLYALVTMCTYVYLHPDPGKVTLCTYVYLHRDPGDSSGCTRYIGKMIVNG